MSVKTKRALWLGSAVTFAFAGFATIAFADDAEKVKITEGVQVAQATTPAPAAGEAQPEEKKVERVVVTGSRLKKNEFTSSSPIQVITSEESTLEGLNDTADILQGSTLAAGSQQINNTFGGFVTQGGPGANTISLRGLGAQRTLVLVNGRRVAPAGTRGQVGQVDLNTIPSSLIDRIEILKDGGSSVYGSDAVAGVVNVITKQNYDGVSLTANGNMTFEGGGNSYSLSGIWGETFDRGQFMIAAEYFRRDELRAGDRSYFACNRDLAYDSTTGALLDIIDPATGAPKCFNLLEGVVDRVNTGTFPGGGRFVPDATAVLNGGPFSLDLAGFRRVGLSWLQVANRLFPATILNGNQTLTNTPFTAAALLTPAQQDQVTAAWRASQAAVPVDDPRFLGTTVIAPVTRYDVFLQGAYDLLPGIEAYTEMAFNRRESEQERWRQLFPNVGATNPNNPLGVTSRSIVQVPTDAEQTVDYYRGLLGIRGDLGEKWPIIGSWSYDLYLQHVRAEADYTNDIIYDDRVFATTQSGSPCVQALITISGGNCANVPTGIRWFDAGVVANAGWSAAESAFLFTKETGHTTYTQTLVNGVVTGDAFQLPYGVVSAAVGFELRRDEIDDTPGFNARNNNLWGQTSAGRTAGSDSVAEVFGEVSLPLLRGMKFAEDLTLDMSGRYTNYESYGDGSTYKIGLNYQITPEYRLRGTTGTSFRAPALFEQKLANQTGFLAQNANLDPCINWGTSTNAVLQASCNSLGILPTYAGVGSSALIISGGGANLEAETSEARTVGFIWTPDWIDFSMALDYWEYEVNDEVAQFGAFNIIFACHTQAPVLNPANPFCGLYQRDLAAGPTFGRIIQVNNNFVNISSQVSDGIDLALRYEHEFSFGTFRANADLTWTFTDEVKVFTFTALNDFNGNVYDPDFVGSVNLRFDWTDWTFFWDIDMAQRSSNNEDPASNPGPIAQWRTAPINAQFKQFAEFGATHDISARYRADDWSIVFGVQNVFDDEPPTVSANFKNGPAKFGDAIVFGGPYDILGRRGFIEVTKEF